jgi:hypothetical protein
MKRFVRENGLGLGFGALFLATLVGQALVGHADFNAGQAAHHGDPIGLWRYVLSSNFGVDVLENWQSEYLQFTLYIVGTVWLLQKGSPESKELDKAGGESDRDQKIGEYATADSPKWARVGGLRTRLYANSLLLVMGTIFLLCWLGEQERQQPGRDDATEEGRRAQGRQGERQGVLDVATAGNRSPQPSMPVAVCGAPTGFDSGEPRWRR